jgi:hypothetical protein
MNCSVHFIRKIKYGQRKEGKPFSYNLSMVLYNEQSKDKME